MTTGSSVHNPVSRPFERKKGRSAIVNDIRNFPAASGEVSRSRMMRKLSRKKVKDVYISSVFVPAISTRIIERAARPVRTHLLLSALLNFSKQKKRNRQGYGMQMKNATSSTGRLKK